MRSQIGQLLLGLFFSILSLVPVSAQSLFDPVGGGLLEVNPLDCTANQFANAIAINGDLACAAIGDADVPNNITIDLATAATALAANGANCAAANFPLGIDASGAVESCTADVDTFVTNKDTHDHVGGDGAVVPIIAGTSGTLTVARGGSGLTAAPANGEVLIGNGTGFALSALTGTADQIVVTNGAGTITLSTPASHLTGTATLDFNLAAVVSQDLTVTVTGAATGNAVSLGIPAASVTADTLFFGWVSAANTVTIRASRLAGTPNPASGTFRADVFK